MVALPPAQPVPAPAPVVEDEETGERIMGKAPVRAEITVKDGDKPREFYWNDPWHYALSRMMVACRAYGLRPIDGPYVVSRPPPDR